MLFATVFGPELEAVFRYISKWTYLQGGIDHALLQATFVPSSSTSSKGQTKNFEDALHYLRSAGLLEGETIYASTVENDAKTPFAAILLRQLQKKKQDFSSNNELDYLYSLLLEQLFILPNRVWINDVHAAVNQLELAQHLGGISQEKVGAWKRVMEFLGLGYRIGGGFYCLYRPDLLLFITHQWENKEGILQEFLEKHLQDWLPCLSARGEIALPAFHAFEYLELQKLLYFTAKQDSPSRPYFGARHLRGIEIP